MKLITALDHAGIELIVEGAVSQGGGRGVRLKTATNGAPLPPPENAEPAAGGPRPGRS
jgi:hypothetical protein